MISYLNYEKPRSAEIIVDEMLAICGEIDAWRNKKDSERANAKYNEMLRRNSWPYKKTMAMDKVKREKLVEIKEESV